MYEMNSLNKIHSQIYDWSISTVIKSNSNKILNSSNPVYAIDKIISSASQPVERAIVNYTKIDFILLMNSLYSDTDHRIDVRIQNFTYKEFLLDMLKSSDISYDTFNTTEHKTVTNDQMNYNRFGVWEYPNNVSLDHHYRVIINTGYKHNSILQLDINII